MSEKASAVFGCARDPDLERLVELLGLLFEQEQEFSPDPRKQRRALAAILGDPAIGRIFVMREGGQVIAMATLLYTISTAEGGRAALFEDLIVVPACRGRGVASALLRQVVDWARQEGITRITLHTDRENRRAQALYRKLGFVASTMTAMRLKLS